MNEKFMVFTGETMSSRNVVILPNSDRCVQFTNCINLPYTTKISIILIAFTFISGFYLVWFYHLLYHILYGCSLKRNNSCYYDLLTASTYWIIILPVILYTKTNVVLNNETKDICNNNTAADTLNNNNYYYHIKTG